MANNRRLLELVDMSHRVGGDPAYVQGGGGNTSIKLDSDLMAVKSSGSMLKEMSPEKGFCILDYQATRSYLMTPHDRDDLFSEKIQSFCKSSESRPSMESGFHALLGDAVIHTHSVFANVLTCSKEGESIVQELFPEALWLSYTTPGRELTIAIRDILKGLESAATVIFLQNHGVIVSAASSQEALGLHEELNLRIRKKLGLKAFKMEEYVSNDLNFMKDHVLFPDQVVYTLSGDEILKTLAARETIAAYNYISSSIDISKLTPKFVSKEKVELLRSMESEKYRQSVLEGKNRCS